MPDWLEICIPFGLIILGCIAVFLIKKIASYRADRLEEEEVKLLVNMADTFQQLSEASAESSISYAKFAESCREAIKTTCSNFTKGIENKIEEIKHQTEELDGKYLVYNSGMGNINTIEHEVETWVPIDTKPRRLKCQYCGCISEKDYGTCEHCGAPLIEEKEK
jgi:myo-inositol-1-phosphate synthase